MVYKMTFHKVNSQSEFPTMFNLLIVVTLQYCCTNLIFIRKAFSTFSPPQTIILFGGLS